MPTTRWSSLHLLPEGERWIIAAVVSSIERALIDALVFGHSSATGTDPDAGATREYTRRARSIVELERAMAPEAQATTDGAPTADASAWAGFHAARERQIADYWARRSRILPASGVEGERHATGRSAGAHE